MKKVRSFNGEMKIVKYEGLFFLAIQETEDKESYFCLKLKKDYSIDSKYLNSSHVLLKNSIEIIGVVQLVADYYIFI